MTLFECIGTLVIALLALGLLSLGLVFAPASWPYTIAVAKASWHLAHTHADSIVCIVGPLAPFVTIYTFAARREIPQRSNP